MKSPVCKSTNDFPKKLNNTYEDIDVYIDCLNDTKIFHYGRDVLQAYIPSIGRGRNVVRNINEINPEIIFNIEETDSEVLFKFNTKYDNQIIPLLKPRTNGASISPFSSKNLPKNKAYKIPDEEFVVYKNIVSKIPKERILDITHITNNYLKSLATKKNKWEDIKADMIAKGLKGKEYIHSIGKWNDYIDYLRKEIK